MRRHRNRSRFIEDAGRELLARDARTVREARYLEIFNTAADALDRAMKDVLAPQTGA